MNIQFNHARKYDIVFEQDGTMNMDRISSRGGKTIALEVIEAWYFDTLQPGTFFEKMVGSARCSDDDNYNRKTGRELSKSRMKNKRLTCIAREAVGDTTVIVLQDQDENRYVLRKESRYNKVHFVEYYG